MTTLWDIFALLGISYTLAIVSLGALIIGFTTGFLSVLFVNQRRSILGDTIAHSTLPGIAIVFLVILQKERILLMMGGLLSALLAVALLFYITRRTSLKDDVAIGIALSFFVSIGIVLITFIQRLSITAQAGLNHYLFGNISFLRLVDLSTYFTLSLVALGIIFMFYKEFKLLIFDREFAIVLGLPTGRYEALLLALVTFVIVLSVENMGVLLVAGLLIGPAIAARQWSNNFSHNLILGGLIGSFSGVMGTVISSNVENTPPGPMIIVILFTVVLFSVLVGKENGILANWIHRSIFHIKVDHVGTMRKFLTMTNGYFDKKGFDILEFDINNYPKLEPEVVQILCDCGYCIKLTQNRFSLTYKGLKAVQAEIFGGSVA